MSCQKQLSWFELFPVFSFLFLKGRCRNCKTKISLQYPIVEFLSGIIFAVLFIKFQDVFFLDTLSFTFSYAYYGVSFSLLLVVSVYDIRHKIIPDPLVLLLAILSFVGLFLFDSFGLSAQAGFSPHIPSIVEFSAGPIVAAPFALFWLISSGRWMGFGDAKLAVVLGWLVGLSRALSGFVLAFWVGAIVGLSLLVFSKKYGMKSEIPFAPYLVLGIFLAFVFELHIFGI